MMLMVSSIVLGTNLIKKYVVLYLSIAINIIKN